MLLVKSNIQIENNEIFLVSNSFIPKGESIWKLIPGFDIVLTKAQAVDLPIQFKLEHSKYTFYEKQSNLIILCFDNAKYIKQDSESFNIYRAKDNFEWISLKDIQKGDRLRIDKIEFMI